MIGNQKQPISWILYSIQQNLTQPFIENLRSITENLFQRSSTWTISKTRQGS